jgi:hypothetical protein
MVQINFSFFVAMFRWLSFWIFISAFNVSAQMIDMSEGKTFGDPPFFNQEFVKRNKLKTISGYYSTKATLQAIKKTKDIYYYEFNDQGLVVKEFRTQYADTIVSMYAYDDLGRLITLRKSDSGGFESYHYTYDQKNRVLSQEYRRDLNKTGDKLDFSLDKSFIVSIDVFEYQELDSLNYKKIYLNAGGKIYKEEFFTYNSDGYLVSTEARFKMGGGLSYTYYNYDENGRLGEKRIEKKGASASIMKWTYTYDNFGNVLSENYYKDEVYVSEIQLVYEPSSLLLSAYISRDVASNLITILQLAKYTYFE